MSTPSCFPRKVQACRKARQSEKNPYGLSLEDADGTCRHAHFFQPVRDPLQHTSVLRKTLSCFTASVHTLPPCVIRRASRGRRVSGKRGKEARQLLQHNRNQDVEACRAEKQEALGSSQRNKSGGQELLQDASASDAITTTPFQNGWQSHEKRRAGSRDLSEVNEKTPSMQRPGRTSDEGVSQTGHDGVHETAPVLYRGVGSENGGPTQTTRAVTKISLGVLRNAVTPSRLRGRRAFLCCARRAFPAASAGRRTPLSRDTKKASHGRGHTGYNCPRCADSQRGLKTGYSRKRLLSSKDGAPMDTPSFAGKVVIEGGHRRQRDECFCQDEESERGHQNVGKRSTGTIGCGPALQERFRRIQKSPRGPCEGQERGERQLRREETFTLVMLKILQYCR